jgi:hypothetical protein
MTRERAEQIREFHGLEMTTADQLMQLGDRLEVRDGCVFRRVGADPGIPLEPALAWREDDNLWRTTEAWIRDEIRERLDLVAYLD